MNVLLLILGLFMFVGLVVIHEFGHFIAARRNNVEVEEFGIGFPPKLWSKKLKNKTLLTINLLPLGGFVKLKGEHDADTEPGSYGAASLWVKTKIIVAGIGMNLVAAWVLFTVVALMGMPVLIDNQFHVPSDTKVTDQKVYIAYVEPDSPAAKIGLQAKDQLVGIGSENSNYNINTIDELHNAAQKLARQTVQVKFVHNSQEQTATTQLRSNEEVEASLKTDNPKGQLGISPVEHQLRRSTWSAPITAAGTGVQFTILTYKGLWTAVSSLFRGDTATASSQVSGPIGVVAILKDGSLLGVQFMLMIIAVISLTLAIMNVLPIPALDGGRLFVTYLFRLMRKPLTAGAEEWIHGLGFMFLFGLLILISFVDVKRFF